MFQMTTVEIMTAICVLSTCFIMMIMAHHIFTDIENCFTKLKNEKNILENRIEELEKKNNAFKNLQLESLDTSIRYKYLTDDEIEVLDYYFN